MCQPAPTSQHIAALHIYVCCNLTTDGTPNEVCHSTAMLLEEGLALRVVLISDQFCPTGTVHYINCGSLRS
jgi:hypothetical protein